MIVGRMAGSFEMFNRIIKRNVKERMMMIEWSFGLVRIDETMKLIGSVNVTAAREKIDATGMDCYRVPDLW